MKIKCVLPFLILHIASYAQDTANMTVEQKMIAAKEYFTGTNNRPRNKVIAISLYQDCANKGNLRAMNMIGYLNANGINMPQNKVVAQSWLTRAAENGYAESWYHLGMLYKDEKDTIPDYVKAYSCFTKAAQLNNVMGIYSQGYMHYKGLGCTQDYLKAVSSFRKAADLNNANSMYFLGLCFRNGYGVSINNDSAVFWLTKAAQNGYIHATNELNSTAPENSNTEAARISAQIRTLSPQVANRTNQYNKIKSNVSSQMLQGKYTGHIVRYDWSGKNAIGSSLLRIDITFNNGLVTGKWIEADTTSTTFQAELTPTEMVFKNTKYSRKDRYSYNQKIEYSFQSASLQWTEVDGEIIISGTIQMFSPKRNEPEKPLFISVRKKTPQTQLPADIDLTSGREAGIKAYPSPFNETVIVEIIVKQKSVVITQLYNTEGKELFRKSETLEPGYYKLPVHQTNLTPGMYVLKVQIGNELYIQKILKQ